MRRLGCDAAAVAARRVGLPAQHDHHARDRVASSATGRSRTCTTRRGCSSCRSACSCSRWRRRACRRSRAPVARGDRPGLDRSFSEIVGLVARARAAVHGGPRAPARADRRAPVRLEPASTSAPRPCGVSGLALLYYALGLVPIALARIYVNLCVAHENTRTGAHAAIVSLVVNVVGALVLVGPLPVRRRCWDSVVERAARVRDRGLRLPRARAGDVARGGRERRVRDDRVARPPRLARCPPRAWLGYLRLLGGDGAPVQRRRSSACGSLPTPEQASLAAALRSRRLIARGRRGVPGRALGVRRARVRARSRDSLRRVASDGVGLTHAES